MFREILDYVAYKLKRVVTSRLFPVTLVFLVLFSVLILRMFHLQVVAGADAQQEVENIISRTVTLAPRGYLVLQQNA